MRPPICLGLLKFQGIVLPSLENAGKNYRQEPEQMGGGVPESEKAAKSQREGKRKEGSYLTASLPVPSTVRRVGE